MHLVSNEEMEDVFVVIEQIIAQRIAPTKGVGDALGPVILFWQG